MRQRSTRQETDTFKQNLIRLLGKIDEIEREEKQKNPKDIFLDNSEFIRLMNIINVLLNIGGIRVILLIHR